MELISKYPMEVLAFFASHISKGRHEGWVLRQDVVYAWVLGVVDVGGRHEDVVNIDVIALGLGVVQPHQHGLRGIGVDEVQPQPLKERRFANEERSRDISG